MSVISRIGRLVGRTGYELRRSDAKRRSTILQTHEVDLVLDIGAASGSYGAELRRFGYVGDIISYEPLREAFESLQSRSDHDPRWSAVQVAIGDRSGTGDINVAGNTNSSSFLPMLDRHVEEAPQTAYDGTEGVQIETLDSISLDDVKKSSRAYAKIDTQGYERSVLDGANEVIPLLHGIQIELSFIPLYADGILYDEVINRLTSEGFQLESIEPGFRSSSTQQLLQADFLFFRPSSPSILPEPIVEGKTAAASTCG